TWQARQGAELLDVTWNEGRLAATSSAGLRKEYQRRAEHPGEVVRDDGRFADAAAHAAKMGEAVYEVPYLAHATMEPMNCTAHVSDDHCEVWAPTQSPALVVEEARRILGLTPSKIVVHQTLVGGGFGRRAMTDFVAEAIHVSRRVRRPVKVVFSRED